MEPSQGVLTRSATLKAAAAAALLARLDISLSIATCMAEGRFGEAVGCLVLMSRAFYSDAQLWGAFKEHQGPKGRTRRVRRRPACHWHCGTAAVSAGESDTESLLH